MKRFRRQPIQQQAASVDAFARFRDLSRQYSTPAAVQVMLRRDFAYNLEATGESVSSALATWQKKTAHCFEASMLAAAVLEHHGYPPLVLSLESQDGLDHVLFVFKDPSGWGAISRSREDGLHGRAPVFRSLRDLARSYAAPYVDESSRLTGFALANLDDSGTPWRDSPRNLWKAEEYLIELPHTPLLTSERRYQYLKTRHKEFPAAREAHWW